MTDGTKLSEAKREKVMLVVPMLHQGGFERVCITTARLLESYFDITIVIFDSADIDYDISGLNIIDLHLGVREGKLHKILNMLRRSRSLRRLKKQLQPKVAYSFGLSANLVNALSKTADTGVWLGLRSYGDLEETHKVKLFVKKADLIICCSEIIEQQLKKQHGAVHATTLYNPFDVKGIREIAEEKKPELPWNGQQVRCLISMGREDDVKGFWHLLKAFSEVYRELPDTRLIILGAGDFTEYRELAEKLEIGDAVFFAGMQKNPYCYLQQCTAYVLTSSMEGFPNALVEGMALGLAAVSTNCLTGPAEILLENAAATNAFSTNASSTNASSTNATEENLSSRVTSAPELSKRNDDESLYNKQESLCDKQEIIHGRYGILVPVMSSVKDLSTEISAEEKTLAEAIQDLLKDDEKLLEYQSSAARRAEDFSHEIYTQTLKHLLEAEY